MGIKRILQELLMINKKWIDKVRQSKNYKQWVGKVNDLTGSIQFNILTMLGLREHHYLLDIGCGSLRGGKLFIPYLLIGRYFAIEPERWLIDEAIKNEISYGLVNIKKPKFDNNDKFNLKVFNKQFDYILCNSVFIHASKKQIEKCISQIKMIKKEDGYFVFNYIEGDDNKNENWSYPSHVTYTENTIRKIVEKNNLVYQSIDWYYPGGQKWVLVS
jgi:2-polyprenyl-3-methyl-5-hydroxy-6-metoxy-1,4-benzoquinol methylase